MRVPPLPPQEYVSPNPDYTIAECEGSVGISADSDADRLIAAYRRGIFPWFRQNGLFYWFATAPRTVLLPENIHIGKSLAKALRGKAYRVTVNQALVDVIAGCAATPYPNQDGTWIVPELQTAYFDLHRLGFAHSFECWYPDTDDGGRLKLAGGSYGVQIGHVFYGESIFARAPDASEITFACAVPFLERYGVELIDYQQDTEHLKRFGLQQMGFHEFHTALVRLNDVSLKEAVGWRVLADNVKRQDQGRGADLRFLQIRIRVEAV